MYIGAEPTVQLRADSVRATVSAIITEKELRARSYAVGPRRSACNANYRRFRDVIRYLVGPGDRLAWRIPPRGWFAAVRSRCAQIVTLDSPDSPLVLASGTEDLLRLLQILSSMELPPPPFPPPPLPPPMEPQLLTLSSCSREKLLGLNSRSPALRRFAAIARALALALALPLTSPEHVNRLSFVLESAAISADSKLPRHENLS